MDTESDSLNMNNLEEMILDENKLVTYLYLSRKLCIHVNESKLLLQEFVNKQSKKDINVQFVISGIDHDNKLRTFICPQGDIEKARNNFKKLFFQHIYSVKKGHESVDTMSLTNIDKFSELLDCIGFIKSSTCLKHSINEIGTLKQNSLKAISNTDNVKTQTKALKTENSSSNSSIGHEQVLSKPVSPKKHKDTKIDKTSPKKTKPDIAHFFNKQNGAGTKPKNEKKTSNMMNSFIKKSNNSNQDKEPLVECHEKANLGTNYNISKLNKSESEILQEKPKSEKKSNGETMNNEAKISTKGKNKNKPADIATVKNRSFAQIKKNGKVDKKRKRVLQMSDSEDSEKEKDDMFEDETPLKMEVSDDDDVIPPTPDAHLIKYTSDKINPKKKRKIVDKTYTDEDGYILTKKEEVYESCSEDEGCNKAAENNADHDTKPEQMKKNEAKLVKQEASNVASKQKKKVSPPKGKQASLMNFFKKKT